MYITYGGGIKEKLNLKMMRYYTRNFKILWVELLYLVNFQIPVMVQVFLSFKTYVPSYVIQNKGNSFVKNG